MTSAGVATTFLVLLGLALLIGPWILGTANRLDRLHVRTDAAWAALDAALARRAVVTRAVGAVRGVPELATAASRAERAPRAEREAAENELAVTLSDLDRTTLAPALAAELLDAEQRVVLARRVHNDAVRDTLALRRRRPVRWLRLAGTAPTPSYFEIAEPVADGEVTALTPRTSARLLLLDEQGRVLLFEGADPARPDELFWFTAGGGVEPGEDLRAAAVREAHEETGLHLSPEDLIGPIWKRHAVFSYDNLGYTAVEWFFVAHVPPDTRIDTSGFETLEHETIRGHRWWSTADLGATKDTVYPVQLADHLDDAAEPWDGTTRQIR
ncbi:NUDIX domain-containing protein [Saccharothrix violaceirubra]|uniref:8-oxo-dGTP pyrophosphatase MutT (NUDIX family) n=1 Tax=Saccharothrix violaceirubra TaxID=413306 RepID=A0A7W7WV29_9PSEU|nr:NUDIX domain-containing protein [Saccharothrix violaceirubra]MBB4964879.1 8-oxo-dGTP pyrophosphatase MutT (NUDIX family) [Saccharothrix violaceirubra]